MVERTWLERVRAFPTTYSDNIRESLKMFGIAEGNRPHPLDVLAIKWWSFKIAMLTLRGRPRPTLPVVVQPKELGIMRSLTDDEQRLRRDRELAMFAVIARLIEPGSRGFIIAPNIAALHDITYQLEKTWPTVRTFSRAAARWEFANGAIVRTTTNPTDYDAGRGMELDWVWLAYPTSVNETNRWVAHISSSLRVRRGQFWAGDMCLIPRSTVTDPRRA